MNINEIFRLPRSVTSRFTPPICKEIHDITVSSESANASCAFVCTEGVRVDSHIFAREAYVQGCRCFIAQKPLDLPNDADVFYTDNTRALLPFLADAVYDYPSRKLHLVGITGTKGKTSVSSMIHGILNYAGISCGIIGTCGIRFADIERPTDNTTPNPIVLQKNLKDMVQAGISTVVIEVSSQSYLMHRVDNLRFQEAIFTNLSHDHVGSGEHPSFHNYKECKKQLFQQCDFALLNGDDEYFPEFAEACKCPCESFGSLPANRYHYKLSDNTDDFSSQFIFSDRLDNIAVPASIPMPGYFNVENACAAISLCKHLGVSVDISVSFLRKHSIPGRFETFPCENGVTFIIDYAHNGVSTEHVLRTVRERKKSPGRIITLFGSVGGRTKDRREEIGVICSSLSDFSIITTDNPDSESPEEIIDEIASFFDKPDSYIKIKDRAEAIQYAVQYALPGDVVLLLGKGHETYQIINGKKIYFSEKQVLKECLKAKGICIIER